jgi:hypothetical protein
MPSYTGVILHNPVHTPCGKSPMPPKQEPTDKQEPRDEPVKLPMPFEEALADLMATGKPRDGEPKPRDQRK